MQFRILGPLEVSEGGRVLQIASGHQSALLALLLIHANRPLTADQIADAVWGGDVPGSGAKALSFHVSRLRGALSPESVAIAAAGNPTRGHRTDGPIRTVAGGYVLHVDPDDVDSLRFERLVRAAHDHLAADPAAARAQLVEALALWRGEALVDVAYEEFAQPEIRRLEELRLSATEDRLEADLAVGHHLAVVGELQALVEAEPLRERLRAQLMLALYRSGRQAEALRVAGEARRLLSEELGIDPSPELARLEAWILAQDPRLDLAGPMVAAAATRPRNPFKGLSAFTEADSADFFGREALVARLVARLDEVSHDGRMLVVVGRSGSGKSSAVRAGLLPAVRAGRIAGSERWRVATMVPGTHPFHELAAALRTAGAFLPDDAAERAERQGDIAPLLEACVRDGAPRLLLVIDQLEELYVRVADEPRNAFTTALLTALGAAGSGLLVVATLRADFFDRPLASTSLGDLIRRGVEVVTPLTRAELERAVTRPAEAVGASVEPGLVADIGGDVEGAAAALPLLEYALTDLFEQSDGRQLTREGYRAIGGAMESVARRAEGMYLGLDEEGREVARQVLVRLAVPGGGGEETGRSVLRSELRTLADDPARVDMVLDALGRQRLLTFDRDPISGEPAVQAAHEALFTAWPRLAGWLDDLRQDLWVHRRLSDAAAEWTAAGRERGFLAVGGRLETFEAWARTARLRLSPAEEAYLAESAAERERLAAAETRRTAWERRLQRRSRTFLLGLTAVLAVAAVAGGMLSVALLGERQAADRARQVAVEHEVQARARELAMGSIASLGKDGQLSVLLGLQAAAVTADRGYVVEEAYDALHWALQDVQVPYPPDATMVATRQAPEGLRGVFLLTPDALMRRAAAYVTRDLSPQECRTYLHLEHCPVVVPPSAMAPALSVLTASGEVGVASLAGTVGAGTHVRVASELPVDLAPAMAAFQATSGIGVEWDHDQSGDLAARIATDDDLPDLAIVSRPWSVASTGHQGRLIDISTLVDVSGVRSDAGAYAMGLGTVGPNGDWPAASGRLYAVPVVMSVDDLLWYPRDAFAAAGYQPPSSRQDLLSLISTLRADRRVPWCLGTEAGAMPGRETSSWIEDFVLDEAGVDSYDGWVSGRLNTVSTMVQPAFDSFERLLTPEGAVFNGLPSAALTPETMAAWPMQLDSGPGCWLFRGASTDRLSFQSARAGRLAAVPFPPMVDSASTLVLGRVWSVVVLHDRPEVRRALEELLGAPFAASMTPALAAAGFVAVRDVPAAPDDVMAAQTARLRAALAAGSFRARALDLFPPSVADAFRKGVLDDLAPGGPAQKDILLAIDQAWSGGSP